MFQTALQTHFNCWLIIIKHRYTLYSIHYTLYSVYYTYSIHYTLYTIHLRMQRRVLLKYFLYLGTRWYHGWLLVSIIIEALYLLIDHSQGGSFTIITHSIISSGATTIYKRSIYNEYEYDLMSIMKYIMCIIHTQNVYSIVLLVNIY